MKIYLVSQNVNGKVQLWPMGRLLKVSARDVLQIIPDYSNLFEGESIRLDRVCLIRSEIYQLCRLLKALMRKSVYVI